MRTTPGAHLGRSGQPPLPPAAVWIAVAVGGLLGTEARYGLGLLYPEGGGVPWTTLLINVAGSLLLGMVTAFWVERPGAPAWLHAGLGPGLLGSFTTFSAVTIAIEQLAAAGRHGVWLAYLGLSLAAGLAAAVAGLGLGRVLGRRAAGSTDGQS
jgi:CrcB protein